MNLPRHETEPIELEVEAGPDELGALVLQGYRFAFSLTHDRMRAEDLVQDALLRTLAAGGPMNSGYLLRCVRNQFVDECRRDRRGRFEPLDVRRAAALEASPSVPATVGAGLETALASLSADDRAALYLWAVEECSTREIAQILGRPRGTVLSGLWRSRRRLRKLLSSQSRLANGGTR